MEPVLLIPANVGGLVDEPASNLPKLIVDGTKEAVDIVVLPPAGRKHFWGIRRSHFGCRSGTVSPPVFIVAVIRHLDRAHYLSCSSTDVPQVIGHNEGRVQLLVANS